MPEPFDPEDLEGSILGEVLKPYLKQDADVYVAPTLGLDFVEAWKL